MARELKLSEIKDLAYEGRSPGVMLRFESKICHFVELSEYST
jgi:hypothetical protein